LSSCLNKKIVGACPARLKLMQSCPIVSCFLKNKECFKRFLVNIEQQANAFLGKMMAVE